MKKDYKIWIFAGESSGDAYGADLAKSLKALFPSDKSLVISGMGGEKMRSAGVDIIVDSSELGVVGFVEVFGKIFTFIRIFRDFVARAEREKPDAVVLIDYPGFNLRFAEQMKKKGIPVVWYVSPQVWAWGKKRIPKLAEFCKKMLVIFPFETKTYAGSGLDTEFVGHPLVEIVRRRQDPNIKRDKKLILILPGSRDNEIRRLLMPMLETAVLISKTRPEFRFAVSLNRPSIYKKCLKIFENFKRKFPKIPEINFYCGETERLLQEADAGMAASGTVTVECAIAKLPLIVAYKLNPITYFIGKMLVSLPYFTMVDIICGELVFREFLQDDVNPKILSSALLEIVHDGPRRAYVEKKMAEMTQMISSGSEKASDNAARSIMQVAGAK
ncbi:MAG TPA: lipid-A-disaccharide synthase [Victivallales bacterium]|nr:lipid-A-disaccharide synthase [Victivallales bacterium]